MRYSNIVANTREGGGGVPFDYKLERWRRVWYRRGLERGKENAEVCGTQVRPEAQSRGHYNYPFFNCHRPSLEIRSRAEPTAELLATVECGGS